MTAVAGRETNAQQVPSSASRAITAEGEDVDGTGISFRGGAVNHRSGYRRNL